MNLISPNPEDRLSVEEIEVRIWAFVVIAITVILFGIVFALLYSVTFVVQPIKSMAPIDQAYTKMLNDIVLLLVGGIGGIVGKRVVGNVAGTLAGNKVISNIPGGSYTPPQAQGMSYPSTTSSFGGALPTFVNPQLDESWTPPPPPSGPPVLEDDHTREHTAIARALATND